MSTSQILESLRSHRHHLELRFRTSIRLTSLVDANFSIDFDEATPSGITLKPIVLADHYNSVYKTLNLYYETLPPEDGTFTVTMSNLVTVSGFDLSTESQTFTYGFDNSGIIESQEDDDTVSVIDHSIRADVTVSSETIYAANPEFYIVSTDPEHGEIFIEEDHNKGRIAITFNTAPDAAAVNTSGMIKVQRKKIGVGLNRWEAVDVSAITVDDDRPVVFIYVTSLDDGETYGENDQTYFASGYKYRVRISGDLYPQG